MDIPRPLCTLAAVLATAGLVACRTAASARPDAAAPSAAARRDTASAPPWRHGVRYGGGPSFGAPPSSYDGSAPPARWCLDGGTPDPAKPGLTLARWQRFSRGRLRQLLADTTEVGATWRNVLGGAPRIGSADSVVVVTDEARCREVARVVHRDVLGWEVGPPPVVLLGVRDFLVAFPSNAHMGEFGYAVGMTRGARIVGVATW